MTARDDRGVTLLEILVAMIILGLVTGGIFAAFVMGRRITARSEGELAAAQLVSGTLEELRLPNALPGPGIYVDDFMAAPPAGAQRLALLNLQGEVPPNGKSDFRLRFMTDAGRTPQPTFADHGDGCLLIVEGADDLDGDGLQGTDLDGDATVDLNRIKVRIKFTSPRP
ncbi:MAG: prepilin-type N-terminal cleavage/methylation domain-containing protein [Candidatus Omnitrophica bacterium]|nr:prepilin-type N-terminal cleavage/methylation domain-containing protein [Candidatus Omnitrophota bacterium]